MRGSSSTRAHAPAWAGAVLEDIYPVRWAGKQAVVTLPEDIDLSNAGQIREQLLTVINRGAAVLIADMTATISCDYAGSEAMIRAYQRAVPSGTDLRLVVTDRIVRRVLSYNGLDRLVSIYPSLEAAQAVKAPAEVLGLVPRPASARADGQAPPRGSTPAGSQLPPAWPSDRNRAAVTSAELWSLVDALQDGVALADGDGALALASRRLEEMFGYEHGELLGQAVERLIPADLQAAHRSHRATYAKAPRTRPMADRLVGLRKDATTFPVEISLSPVTTVSRPLRLRRHPGCHRGQATPRPHRPRPVCGHGSAGTRRPGTPGHDHHPLVSARAQPAGRYRPARGHGRAARRRSSRASGRHDPRDPRHCVHYPRPESAPPLTAGRCWARLAVTGGDALRAVGQRAEPMLGRARAARPTRLAWFHQLRCSRRMRRNDGGLWTLAGELPGEQCWRVMCWVSAVSRSLSGGPRMSAAPVSASSPAWPHAYRPVPARRSGHPARLPERTYRRLRARLENAAWHVELHKSACRTNPDQGSGAPRSRAAWEQGFQIWGSSRFSSRLCDRLKYANPGGGGNARSCRISDVSASTMWLSRGRVLPRGRLRPSDLQRAPAYLVTPDRPEVSLKVMKIDGMTLCEREARGERAQSCTIYVHS